MKKGLMLVLMSIFILAGCEASYIDSYAPAVVSPQEWTIEELGQTIVSAGKFWEEWWDNTGKFSHENIDFSPSNDLPEHFPSAMYYPLLPTSGFSNLDDIRKYLLQFYTEKWVDTELTMAGAPFVEYDGLLYVHVARAGMARPGWWTASHIIVEREGNVTVIDTTLLHGSWGRMLFGCCGFPFEVKHRFTLVNGKIDSTPGEHGWILPSYEGRFIYPICITSSL